MTGSIGILESEGQQVAGFLNWVIEGDGRLIQATASAFWLIKPINPDKYTATFYQRHGNGLLIFNMAEVKADFPGSVVDRLIHSQMALRFL